MYFDNRLLETLVAYADNETVQGAADELMISQPTVTRNLQKLEDDIGVKLFNRSANKIELNTTGRLAAQRARELLDAQHQCIQEIQQYNFGQHHILLAATAPGPALFFTAHNPELPHIDNDLLEHNEVGQALMTYRYSAVFTTEEIFTDTIESFYIGEEYLCAHVDAKLLPADKGTVTFEELNHLRFLVLTGLGQWQTVIERNIPHAKFISQNDRDDFLEIIDNSTLAHFSTNLSTGIVRNTSRRRLRITDAEAILPLYLTYLISEKQRLQPVIDAYISAWPNDDALTMH
ncbi:LysR family transcriptional regulator [Bifidobacterium tsurumiense]|uniref:LysR family transcriptional regulator n=1 Tax=Bifidobacterium tsurumiense TaxID=356829 RepID=A0A087EET0_9BIFI|nr:LysR family transcriptional regulator [Bifidobacterium tsurumiense]KFJ06281.1 LysR family transcriptional regulator [Bifidobacterium tsurumiense]MDY4678048.1 LysR family transcriptional regulator [Bifidobacterium tsurumiense]MSS12099.1 LysR family transcriptional regulator [Bifidobacterium tsurumiense]